MITISSCRFTVFIFATFQSIFPALSGHFSNSFEDVELIYFATSVERSFVSRLEGML